MYAPKHFAKTDPVLLRDAVRRFGPGELITFLRAAPLGGPIEVELMGYRLCIRRAEGDKIFVDCNP